MHDMMAQLTSDVSRGVPGVFPVVREIAGNPDRRQAREDLQLLKDLGITGSRLALAYGDVRSNYLKNLETQPDGYQNPFADMTAAQMLTYLRGRDATYLDHVNRLLTKQGHPPLPIS